jgi:hypothetical protein
LSHRPFVSYPSPVTGMILPTADQLRALRRIVLFSHDDWLGDGEGTELEQQRNFNRGFWAAGKFFRVRAPRRDRFYFHWVEVGNQWLEDSGQPPIDGTSLMLGILAHRDIAWQMPDSSVGALLEIAVDQHSGAPCANAWRGFLTGEANLLPPTRPREPDRSIGIVREFSGRVFR